LEGVAAIEAGLSNLTLSESVTVTALFYS